MVVFWKGAWPTRVTWPVRTISGIKIYDIGIFAIYVTIIATLLKGFGRSLPNPFTGLFDRLPWTAEGQATQKNSLHYAVRKGERYSHQDDRLPIELWELILNFVIYCPYVFDTTCEPHTFLQFVNSRKFRWFLDYRYKKSERVRRNMRLVCRLWRDLVDRHPARWLCGEGLIGTIPTRGVERIDFRTPTPPSVSILSPYGAPSLQQSLARVLAVNAGAGTRSKLSVLSIYCTNPDQYHGLDKVLFAHARELPAVRSFAFDTPSTVLHTTLLANLRRSFTSLTCLFISAQRIQGSLRLEGIEILMVKAASADLDEWYFPSLRQLSLEIGPPGRTAYRSSLVPGPVQNLRSLLFPTGDSSFKVTNEFWKEHPALEFLGVSADALNIIDPPPTSHPLAHLFLSHPSGIVLDDGYGSHSNLQAYADRIVKIPNLQTVMLSYFKYPPHGNRTASRGWIALMRVQMQHGVTFYNAFGRELDLWALEG
ncbi:hypothetical protein FRC18_001749 [Serendipita sp. 400]|nr:hypothetical protein FRC18_001749 [Serendipita sp. 400]